MSKLYDHIKTFVESQKKKGSSKKILMISMVAIMGVAMIAPSVSAEMDFLDLVRGHIVANNNEFMKVSWSTQAQIPTDGSAGAFGFGIISDGNIEAVLVATSHVGVLDSEAQVNATDASLHSHYVALQKTEDGSKLCEGLEIRNITFEEPTRDMVFMNSENNKVRIMNTPYQFNGTDSLTGEDISFYASDDVTDVVSFTIEPILDEDDTILAVCINDVQFMDRFIVISGY